MILSRYNTFFSTLNFVLLFVGYPLVTSLFLPVTSDMEGVSRSVTIPYRAFSLSLSLVVLIFNIKNLGVRKPIGLKLLFIFWLMLIFRIFYDINIRTDVYIKETQQLWLYIWGICLPAIFSVIVSLRYIDLRKALYLIYIGACFSLLLTLFSNQTLFVSVDQLETRVDGNIALNTISFGHLGIMTLILSVFLLLKRNLSPIFKIIVFLVISLSLYTALRAGSRGPILALFIVLFFWMLAKSKNIGRNLALLMLVFIALIIFIEPILNGLAIISPIMEARIRASLYEGDTSGRDLLYQDAIQSFFNNPLLGEKFAIFSPDGGFIYSHNMLLDAFMGLGLMGGLIMMIFLLLALKKSFILIRDNDRHFWISLIFIQQLVLNMLSGAFYYNSLLNALLVFVFLYPAVITKTFSYR